MTKAVYILLIIPISLVTLIVSFPVFIFVSIVMIIFNYYYKESNKIIFYNNKVEIYDGKEIISIHRDTIREIKLDYSIFKGIHYFIIIKTKNDEYKLDEFKINKLNTNIFELYSIFMNWH